MQTLKRSLPTLGTGRLPVLQEKAGTTPRPSGRKWMRTRARELLAGEYRCASCGAISLHHHVDHIVPLEQGGDPLAPSNLQVLCTRQSGRGCHETKSAAEQAARWGRVKS